GGRPGRRSAQTARRGRERQGRPEAERAGAGPQGQCGQPPPQPPARAGLDVSTEEERRRRGPHLTERPERDEHRQPRADRHAAQQAPPVESRLERERYEARQERAYERRKGNAEDGAGETSDEAEP